MRDFAIMAQLKRSEREQHGWNCQNGTGMRITFKHDRIRARIKGEIERDTAMTDDTLEQKRRDAAKARRSRAKKLREQRENTKKVVQKKKQPTPEELKPYVYTKGNGGGRPRGIKGVSQVLREAGRDSCALLPATREMCLEIGLDPVKTPIGALLGFRMILEALGGDPNMMRMYLDRTEGKVPDVLNHNVSGALSSLSDEQLEKALDSFQRSGDA